jgi:hypothetical protein
MFRARFPGKCPGGDAIRAGDLIEARREGGYRHTACRAADRKPVPVYAFADGESDDIGAWERDQALRERQQMDAEYAAGIEDARRWRENSQMFGQEFARDMRGLNGDVW